MFEITDASGAEVRDSESFKIETKNNKNKAITSKHKTSFRRRTFIFFEIIVKIQMCTLFLFKKIKDARLFSNS